MTSKCNIYTAAILILSLVDLSWFVIPCQAQNTAPKAMHAIRIRNGMGTNRIYTNSQFAFEMKIPPELSPVPKVETEKQNIFVSKDGQVQLKVLGQYNEEEKTFPEEYEYQLGQYLNAQVTYKTINKKYFVISGFQDEKIFYLKEIPVSQEGGQIFISFDMEFPQSAKEIWDKVLLKCVKTFGPIPGQKFVLEKDLYDPEEIRPEGFMQLPGMSFQVFPGDGLAKVSWDKVSGAIGYELDISSTKPAQREVIKKISLPQKSTETVVEGLVNGSSYKFEMHPIFRSGTGGGSIQFKWIGTEADINLPAPANFTVQTLKGVDNLNWDEVPNSIGYMVYRSEDGKCYTSLTRYGIHTNKYSYQSLKTRDKYYYAVEAYKSGELPPKYGWAVIGVTPSIEAPPPQEASLLPAQTICPTPYPDSSNYAVSQTIDLTKVKEGFDGKLVLWLGKEPNRNWKPERPEQFKWYLLKPIIKLMDASGNEINRQYFEYENPIATLEVVNPVDNEPPVYLMTSTSMDEKGNGFSLSRIFCVVGGKLDHLKAEETFGEKRVSLPIFLERGDGGREAGNWKWVPSSSPGQKDILFWSTMAPRGSIMSGNLNPTPSTDYVRYHFDGKQWINYKKSEEGFVGYSDKIFPGENWFPDESFFPKTP